VVLVPLVPAVGIPACEEAGAPGLVDVVLLGAVGGVVPAGDVVLGGIGAVGVGEVVVGETLDGAVADGLVADAPLEPVGDAAVPVTPGAPGEPALPIVGLARTKDGVPAPAAPVELARDVTHPVTVTICVPAAPVVAAPGVVWVCAAAAATTEAASAPAKAICLFMMLSPIR
jgi:hypothetical protein